MVEEAEVENGRAIGSCSGPNGCIAWIIRKPP